MKTEAEFFINEIKDCQKEYSNANKQAAYYKNFRDYYIVKAFEEGVRQKEIANASGLSVRTVKLIIGELRKENHELQTR